MTSQVSVWAEVMVDLDDIADEDLVDALRARGYDVIAPEEDFFEDDEGVFEDDEEEDEGGNYGHA
jgi:hypothetical protein